jgi:hypothetical protein
MKAEHGAAYSLGSGRDKNLCGSLTLHLATSHKGVPMSTPVCSLQLRAGKGTAKSSQEVGMVISTEVMLTMKTRSAVPAESYLLFLGCLAIQWA